MMWIAGLFRASPTLQAVMATVLAFTLVATGVGMLRRDARVQAVAQCAAERDIAQVREALRQQVLISLALKSDKEAADRIVSQHAQQLAASDEALRTREKELADLRNSMASNPGEGDVIFDARDAWITRRVRASGSAPAANGGRR